MALYYQTSAGFIIFCGSTWPCQDLARPAIPIHFLSKMNGAGFKFARSISVHYYGHMRLIFLLALFVIPVSLHAQYRPQKSSVVRPFSKTWALPLQVTDSVMQVKYKVDSSLSLLQGKLSGVTGRMWLENPRDPLSIRADVTMPINPFDSGEDSDGGEFLKALTASQFPTARFQILGVQGVCTPEKAEGPFGCDGKLKGKVTIQNIERDFLLPYTILRKGRSYVVEGDVNIKWGELNIPDPSGLFSTLSKTAMVQYRCAVPVREVG